MKTIQFSLILFFTISLSNIYCQNVSEKSLIVYKTYEDFMNNTGLNLGTITNYVSGTWGDNKIVIKRGNKEDKINMNQYWGFRVDDYIFRMNKDGIKLPLLVLKKDEKIFYADGYLYYNKIMFDRDEGSSIRESDGYFYSDNLNSEVFEITKIIKNEKDNPKLKELIECIKKAKKRYGVQSKFNGYSECLK